jgi:hypothetical protein
MVDNALALHVKPLDVATPLMMASRLRQAETESRLNEFQMRQAALGAEARGLAPFANSPDFAQRWAEAADRLRSQGILDPQTHARIRSTPSPLMLESIIRSTSSPELQFRMEEAKRAQQNQDRAFQLEQRKVDATIEGTKIPPGFEADPETAGGLRAKPGGPADPAYIGRVAEQRVKPREFSVTDITKLSEEGGKFANLSGFANTFEDRFAGYKTQAIGNAATWMGRNVPQLVGQDTADAAKWWQGYDRFKNVIRNELFGSALTATEQAAFERADINASMDPATIRANLKRQQEIAQNGLKRKANALITAGYDPRAISAAYGLRLEDLGVSATSRRGTVVSAPLPEPGSTKDQGRVLGPPKSEEEGAPVPNARKAPDGNWYLPDPDRPGKYLLVQ